MAMSVLAIAISAQLAVFSSSFTSIHRAGMKGTALTLADKQMETYRTMAYSCVYLASATGDTAYTGDSAYSGTQVTGSDCSPNATPPTSATTASQPVTGPDGRTYRVDTCIVSSTPTGGRALKIGHGRRPTGRRRRSRDRARTRGLELRPGRLSERLIEPAQLLRASRERSRSGGRAMRARLARMSRARPAAARRSSRRRPARAVPHRHARGYRSATRFAFQDAAACRSRAAAKARARTPPASPRRAQRRRASPRRTPRTSRRRRAGRRAPPRRRRGAHGHAAAAAPTSRMGRRCPRSDSTAARLDRRAGEPGASRCAIAAEGPRSASRPRRGSRGRPSGTTHP